MILLTKYFVKDFLRVLRGKTGKTRIPSDQFNDGIGQLFIERFSLGFFTFKNLNSLFTEQASKLAS